MQAVLLSMAQPLRHSSRLGYIEETGATERTFRMWKARLDKLAIECAVYDDAQASDTKKTVPKVPAHALEPTLHS